MARLKPCPNCGCHDVHLDSSSAAGASWIECEGCDNRFQRKCDEEALAERWNKLNRSAMPEYDDGTREKDNG
jgi:hypothetical protein